jgi:hypothetical protein
VNVGVERGREREMLKKLAHKMWPFGELRFLVATVFLLMAGK